MAENLDPHHYTTRNPWLGLDRRAFCENAILLDLTARSQGTIITSRTQRDVDGIDDKDAFNVTSDFLDDIALLASESGGKDNVSAACLEHDANGEGFVIRISRNDGLDSPTLGQLQSIINLVFKLQNEQTPFDVLSDEVLKYAISTCSQRIEKHASSLLGELKHGQFASIELCRLPSYKLNRKIVESMEDIDLLGTYNRENHKKFSGLIQERFNTVRELSELLREEGESFIQTLCQITELSYKLRRSDLLRIWLEQNLFWGRPKSSVSQRFANDIVQRIRMLSKFYRASINISKFLCKTSEAGINIGVETVATSKFSIPELQSSTPQSLRARFKKLKPDCSNDRLQNKLNRWEEYRMHAEIQLLLYYEQHDHIRLVTDYIGGDKLCCYLCYKLIILHGRFSVNGCHQSLYSLWNIPDQISGLSTQAYDRIHAALGGLCADLQTKVKKKCTGNFYSKQQLFSMQAESCVNLSRISLSSTFSIRRLATRERRHFKLESEVIESIAEQPDPDNELVVTSAEALKETSQPQHIEQIESGSSFGDDKSTTLVHYSSEMPESNSSAISATDQAVTDQVTTDRAVTDQAPPPPPPSPPLSSSPSPSPSLSPQLQVAITTPQESGQADTHHESISESRHTKSKKPSRKRHRRSKHRRRRRHHHHHHHDNTHHSHHARKQSAKNRRQHVSKSRVDSGSFWKRLIKSLQKVFCFS